MSNVFSAVGTVLAALLAAGVWWADHRAKVRAQAESISAWPVVIRRVGERATDEGGDLHQAEGFVIHNSSQEPIWKLTLRRTSGSELPVAVLPPGRFFVYRRDSSSTGTEPLVGPDPVFTRDDDGRLYFTRRGGAGTFEISPRQGDVPVLTFVDNAAKGWQRTSDALKRSKDVAFTAPPSTSETIDDAMTNDEEARRRRRSDVGAFMLAVANVCADGSELTPQARGRRGTPNAELAGLGVAEVYLQGGAGMGMQLRTTAGRDDMPMYYVESGMQGVPQQLSRGFIKRGEAKTLLTAQLRHPRGVAKPAVTDWHSPQEFYDAVLDVLRANPIQPAQ